MKVVNFIKGRDLNHRLFKEFCKEMDAKYTVLLYHTEVRWLSRGRVLKRVFELRKEVFSFLQDSNYPQFELFENEHFLLGLAYLSDIFTLINIVNLSLQGPCMTIIEAQEKIKGFHDKLSLWKRRVENGNLANFILLDEVILENGVEKAVPSSLQNEISQHLSELQVHMKEVCLSEEDAGKFEWVRFPFLCEINSMRDENPLKDELIELKAASSLRLSFNSQNLDTFWISLQDSYPQLARAAIIKIIPFVTTYLCESGFSTMVTIKTKQRNRLNQRHDMRVSLSCTLPNFAELIADKEEQHSH